MVDDIKHHVRNALQVIRKHLTDQGKRVLDLQALGGRIASQCGEVEEALDSISLPKSLHLGLFNPTGMEIRVDSGGSGHFGASRTKTVNGKIIRYAHKGEDRRCHPGQDIYAPASGIMPRVARPYRNRNFSGCLIVGKFGKIKMFYFEPFPELIGRPVEQGQVIGTAQDISEKYPNVLPHIHTQIMEYNPSYLM